MVCADTVVVSAGATVVFADTVVVTAGATVVDAMVVCAGGPVVCAGTKAGASLDAELTEASTITLECSPINSVDVERAVVVVVTFESCFAAEGVGEDMLVSSMTGSVVNSGSESLTGSPASEEDPLAGASTSATGESSRLKPLLMTTGRSLLSS